MTCVGHAALVPAAAPAATLSATLDCPPLGPARSRRPTVTAGLRQPARRRVTQVQLLTWQWLLRTFNRHERDCVDSSDNAGRCCSSAPAALKLTQPKDKLRPMMALGRRLLRPRRQDDRRPRGARRDRARTAVGHRHREGPDATRGGRPGDHHDRRGVHSREAQGAVDAATGPRDPHHRRRGRPVLSRRRSFAVRSPACPRHRLDRLGESLGRVSLSLLRYA